MSDPIIVDAANRGNDFLETIDDRPVYPSDESLAGLSELDVPLQDNPLPPKDVLGDLDRIGSPATVGSAGRRYFGFVTGGVLPAALGANVLAAAWDQNGGLEISSPIGSTAEKVSSRWMLDLLGLPESAATGFVTGATQANFVGLASARHALLKRLGWDVEEDGLFGAPEIKVVVGEEVHVSAQKALSMVGLGRSRVTRVPVDDQGRMIADELPDLDDMTLVLAQLGNVNSGAFDPIRKICEKAIVAGAWVHVDGAFGLWANASPKYAPLVDGVNLADSWATDAHKWLNVPYDSGLVFVKNPEHIIAAMSASASYLTLTGSRQPFHYTPELSRRVRGIEIWAALRSLGRKGLADLIDRNCAQATSMAARLTNAGFEILNDVVLNQVLVSFGSDGETEATVRSLQNGGAVWAGDTLWHGRRALRLSFSSWATRDEDLDKTYEAIITAAKS